MPDWIWVVFGVAALMVWAIWTERVTERCPDCQRRPGVELHKPKCRYWRRR